MRSLTTSAPIPHLHATSVALICFGAAIAGETLPIAPHLDSDGTISWVARIDRKTAHQIEATNPSNVAQALNAWLDNQLMTKAWCRHDWFFKTEPEVLANGELTVRGVCRREPASRGTTHSPQSTARDGKP